MNGGKQNGRGGEIWVALELGGEDVGGRRDGEVEVDHSHLECKPELEVEWNRSLG